jgi:hypothetical protein
VCEETGTSQHLGLATAVMQTCIVPPVATPLVQNAVSTHQVTSSQTMAIDTESRPPKAALGCVSHPFATPVVTHSSAARAWLSAQGACVAPSIDGRSMSGGIKRAHPEAYEVSVEGPRLSFMRRVLRRAQAGVAALTVEQQRQAAEMGLMSEQSASVVPAATIARTARRSVTFEMERVEVRTYLCPSVPGVEPLPYRQSSPLHVPLSTIEYPLDAQDTSDEEDWETASAASDVPSLVSQSYVSDSDEEGRWDDGVKERLPQDAGVSGITSSYASAYVRSILGSIACCSVEQGRSLPSDSVCFNVRRPSTLSNPFFMPSETKRDAVCDAYEEWWSRGDVSVEEVARQFGVPVAFCWEEHRSAKARDGGRLETVASLAQLLNSGIDVTLCCCESAKRCHAATICSSVGREAARQRLARHKDVAAASNATSCDEGNTYLIVYAGSRAVSTRLAAKLALDDPQCTVRELDILNGLSEDVRSVVLQAQVLAQIAAHAYTAVFIAIPCSSYAIVRGVQLRSTQEPEGILPVPRAWRLYLEKHNALSEFGESLAEICDRVGVAWAIENPASRSEKGSAAHWPKFESWGSLWDRPRIKALVRGGAKRFLLPHCAFGSRYQKYIEVMCSSGLLDSAHGLFAHVRCVHDKHDDTAVGRDERGKSKAAGTAAYPEALNVALASLLASVAHKRKRLLHAGSSRPHSEEALLQDNQRAERWAKPGSLRSLEPELESVLRSEALPSTNVPRTSEPVEPPPQPSVVPGPFTTAQLIPPRVVEDVTSYGVKVAKCLERSKRGKSGWQHARRLRPEPLVFEEHEALNPCGHGFAWARVHPNEPLTSLSLWAAITPSHWPDDPPCPEEGVPLIDAVRWAEWAERTKFTDKRIDSWNKHGYPGAGLPNVAVLTPPHVGALKEPTHFEECNRRDSELGFVSPGTSFPSMWPLICDPCNIVVQNGKPRLTIDKSMWISGRTHIPPYNLVIDLDEQGRLYGRLLLVRVWEFTRGAAIMMTAAQASDPVQLELAVFDLMAFFRIHPKQRLHMRESGRIMSNGFSYDRRPNFGERDAPDHTCGESDGISWFSKHEMRRLDAAYPCRVPSINQWLAHRRSLREDAASGEAMDEFLWDVLFFIVFYVDDGGLASWTEPLFDHHGVQIFELVTDNVGVQTRRPRLRIAMYFEACIGVAEYVGHGCPEKKRQYHARLRIYLGIQIDLDAQRRLLPRVKADAYSSLAQRCLRGRREMPNGVPLADLTLFVSLVHKLLHAADTIPLGKQHLFHCRQAIKQAKDVVIGRSRTMSGVLVTSRVVSELTWWVAQLACLDNTGLPLACRYSFPGCSSECNLVRYSDAARELEKRAELSGAGAWCVMRGAFYYVHFTYTRSELEAYSINVLEAHARDSSGAVFLDKAAELGCAITHTTAFVDNTTAQHIAESGRTSTAMLNALNMVRLQRLLKRGVFESNERVTSVDNDVADLLSRGDVEEALRFPIDCGLQCVRLQVPAEYREFPSME